MKCDFQAKKEKCMRIRIVKSNGNWYQVGEEYEVIDSERYVDIGVQVWRNNIQNSKCPDVVMYGHFEYI